MKIQTTECAGNAEKPLSLWPTTNRVFFSGFGCTNGYATLQPHYRPSAKNTTNDCASWKAKSTTLNTWSGRKTTRSVTPTPTPCPTPWLPGKKKKCALAKQLHTQRTCLLFLCVLFQVQGETRLHAYDDVEPFTDQCKYSPRTPQNIWLYLYGKKNIWKIGKEAKNLPSISVFQWCCRLNKILGALALKRKKNNIIE